MGILARQVVLEPLTPTDVQTMLQAIFDLRQPVQPEFLTAIYTLTEGNPFFIEEVLKALVAAGDIFYADGGWTRKPMQELHIPPSVQDAVQRRTQQLSDRRRAACSRWRQWPGGALTLPCSNRWPGRRRSELLAVIKELVAAQLVVEETAEHFAFRHALTRQAVYAQLLGRERQTLHRIIGVAIEQFYPTALDTQVAELSYHFYEAGEWGKALDYARRAGEQAQTLYAPRAAVEQFTRALAAAQHLAQPPSLLPLHRLRGLAYETLGEFEQARADLEIALDLACSSNDRQEEWQILLDLGQLWASRNYEQTGEYIQRALDLARTLEDPTTLARTLNRMGNWYLNVEQSHGSAALSSGGVGHFSGAGRCARPGPDLRSPGYHRICSPAISCKVHAITNKPLRFSGH